jgi:beta-galactosidase
MRHTLLAFILAALTAAPALAVDRPDNLGWRFQRVDSGAGPDPATVVRPEFDDAGWDRVALPHTVRVESPATSSAPFQGIAWYRHTVVADPAWAGKLVSLRFDGAMQVADVWVDGEHRLTHEGGYLPFGVDLTAALRSRGAATVVVRVDNTDHPLVPPGKPNAKLDFCYFGGMYRDAWLRVTDPVHISDPIDADTVAGGGVFVRCDHVSQASADVLASAQVRNDGGAPAGAAVAFSLFDGTGKEVASATVPAASILIAGDHTYAATLTVPHPALWSPDSPSLYTLVTRVVRSDGVTVDQQRTRIGIRTVAFDNGGFHLNGKPLVLRGANRHQDYAWLGNAVPDNASYRDVRLLKEAGFNFLRLAHYPQSPAVMDACDELGVMVSVCTPGWQYFSKDEHFTTLAKRNIREMVRWHSNHPCVAMWEVSLNETYGHDPFYAECARIAHEEYPGDQLLASGDTYASHSSGYLDVPYPVWKGDHNDANPTARWTKAFAREYGDYNFGGLHSTSRVPRAAGEDRLLLQAWNHQWSDNQNAGEPWFAGDCVWAGIDDASTSGRHGPIVSYWGPLDYFRIPKFSYFFYQSLRDPAVARVDVGSGPMVYVANYWTPRPSPAKVVVYSNCDEVELSLNGRPVGRRKPDGGPDSKYGEWRPDADPVYMAHGGDMLSDGAKTTTQLARRPTKPPRAMFDGGNCRHLEHAPFTFPAVPFEPGLLRAVAYRNGTAVATFDRRTPGPAVALRLEVAENGRPLSADGSDAVFVRASVVDANGTVVPDATAPVTFAVTGAARLVTPPVLPAEAGIASALMASTGPTGVVHITAAAGNLSPAALDYTVGSTVVGGNR